MVWSLQPLACSPHSQDLGGSICLSNYKSECPYAEDVYLIPIQIKYPQAVLTGLVAVTLRSLCVCSHRSFLVIGIKLCGLSLLKKFPTCSLLFCGAWDPIFKAPIVIKRGQRSIDHL